MEKIDEIYCQHISEENVTLKFSPKITKEDLYPFHLVTLANIIQFLFDNGNNVSIDTKGNPEVFDFIYNELKFSEYFSKGINHVDTDNSENIFNLWRITDAEKDLYAIRVEEYFKKNYFEGKDLSFISSNMIEAYYNVFDHAKANKNAFSLIKYDDKKHKLYVAISDFGIGIVKSVRDFDSSITNDEAAISKAIQDNFTVKSTERNHGMGLSNILNGSDYARIFSGKGLVVEVDGQIKTYSVGFGFPGTLVYFEVDLSKAENEEIINSFEW